MRSADWSARLSAYEEEMPRSPGEYMVQYLVSELGVKEEDAILAWIELGDYCDRVARMLDEEPENVAIMTDAGFGMFLLLEPEE